jgi:phenylacetate-CoA ligase
MRRMEKITGRSDDMMIVRGVNVFPTQIEELILKRPELSAHYQCILWRDGPLDNLRVAVETRPGLAHEGAEARAAAQRLEHEIKVYVGTSVEVELRAEGGIERSMGKARRVVDQRGKR